MEERVSTKDLLVTTYADVRKDITAKTVKVCSHIIKLCISGERKNTEFPSYRHRPFQICTKPLFQSETKCEAIDDKLFFILMQIILIFSRKVLQCVVILVSGICSQLIPISSFQFLFMTLDKQMLTLYCPDNSHVG